MRFGILFVLAVATACSPSTTDGERASTAPLEAVAQAIQSASTLRLEGTVESDSSSDDDDPEHERKEFVMLLDRSGRYLIAWKEEHSDGTHQDHAVWNAGEGPFMYDGNSWGAVQDEQFALFRAGGGIGQTGFAIKQTFQPTDPAHIALYPLPITKFEDAGTDEIDGTPCRMFVYTYQDGVELALWVEQDRPVFRAIHMDARNLTLEVPAEMRETLTQEELDSMPRTISFESRETFTRFELDADIPVSDFAFEVPDDATERTGDSEATGWEGFQSIPHGGAAHDR